MKLTFRRALLFSALIAPPTVVIVALTLGEWVLGAVAATVAVAVVGLISAVALLEVQGLKRQSNHLSKRVGQIVKDVSHTSKQQKVLGTRSKEVRADLAMLRSRVEASERTTRVALQRTEHAERRLVGIIESFRLEVSESESPEVSALHNALQDGLKDLQHALSDQTATSATRTVNKTVSRLTRVARDETRQIEALLQLLPTIEPTAPLPPTGQWAMDARSLLHLSYICRREAPRNVVEIGSGTSTIWLAYLLRDTASITSVDHDPEWARLTQAALERHGLDTDVKLRTAPLVPIDLAGEGFSWYDIGAFRDAADIDLLLVDGPPEVPGSLARYPALPALHGRLARRCTVVLDDSDRPAETQALERWLEEFEGFTRVDEGVSRLAVLTRVG